MGTEAKALPGRVADRYRVLETLGQGAFATTLLAEPLAGGARVVVKRVSLRAALAKRAGTASLADPDALKAVELFEREAEVLRTLDHPRVPRFVDFFRVEAPDDVELYLVQEHVPGRNLAQWVRDGRHFKEAEVAQIGARIAGVLADLHARTPPVVHRDVKPSNVILREDGEVFLIDFGAVQRRVSRNVEEGGGLDQATVVGTFGYMPPEQFEGLATPASDVFALGATLAFLLTHKPPADLPRKRMRPDVRALVPVSDALAALLDRMLAPLATERPADGAAARDALGTVESEPVQTRAKPRPRFSRRASLTLALLLVGVAVMTVLLRKPLQTVIALGSGEDPRRVTLEPVPVGAPERPAPGVAPIFSRGPDGAYDLLEDAAGHVWGKSWGQLVRFEDGDPTRPTTVFSETHSLWKRLKKVDAGWQPFGVLRFAIAPEGTIFVLGTRGELIERGPLGWSLLMPAADRSPFRQDAAGMAVLGGRLFVARDGVFARDGGGAWTGNHDLPAGTIRSFAVTPSGSLLVGPMSGGVWRVIGDGARQVGLSGVTVTALAEGADGHVFAGTESGFVELDAAGNALPRELAGMSITAFASTGPDRLWVGTATRGLHYREAGLWYRYSYAEGLPARDVSDLLADSHGRLWVSASSGPGGILVADVAAAEEGVKRIPRLGIRPALEFADLEAAAEKLLGERRASGQVSWRRVAVPGLPQPLTMVFFHGRLVFPAKADWDSRYTAFARDDGSGAVLDYDWSGVAWDAEGRTRKIAGAPPPRYGDYRGPPKRAFVDERGDVWAMASASGDALWSWSADAKAPDAGAGTEGDGGAEAGGGVWRKHADFDKLGIGVITEDGDGRVFVATRASREGTLHRWDGATWKRFRCQQTWYPGADSLGIWNLKLRRDGKFIVHRGSAPDAVLFDPKGDALDCMKTVPFGYWEVLTEDREGRFWMTTISDRDGLRLRDGNALHVINSRLGLVDDDVVSHAEDGEGRLWLKMGNGAVAIYASDALAALAPKFGGKPDGGAHD